MKFVTPGTTPEATDAGVDLEHLLSDRRWEALLDLLPDGVVLVDRTGLVRFMNSAAENLTELLRPEAVGRSLQSIVKEARVDLAPALEAFTSGARISRRVAVGALPSYLLTTRSVRSWAGDTTCFLIVLRDVAQLGRADAEAPLTAYDALTEAPAPESATVHEEAMVLCEATALLVTRGLRALALGSRLLLLGESGAGKTELARALHRESGASGRPFVHVNCGSIPESLFESEMFGYERGSFTGASAKGKKGLIEAAEGGVLFLDEVGEIPLLAQAKMLQFLEDSALHKVGSVSSRRLRVQVIAATNRDLYQMVLAGTFRRDLYYRLSVVTLTLPPLRQCPEVIDRLVDRFLARLSQRRSPALRMEPAARRRLRTHGFPGNVRELQNLMEHFAVLCDRSVGERDVAEALAERTADATGMQPVATPLESGDEPWQGGSLKEAVRDFESRMVRDTIRRAGSKRKAAELLGVDIATIVRKSRPDPH